MLFGFVRMPVWPGMVRMNEMEAGMMMKVDSEVLSLANTGLLEVQLVPGLYEKLGIVIGEEEDIQEGKKT